MKSTIIFILSIFFTASTYSQTYKFSKLTIMANVETQNGTSNRVLDTKYGSYKIEFEYPSDPQIKKLFTVLEPGKDYNPNYYALIEDSGYVEKGSTIFQKSIYYDTQSSGPVQILTANDKSIIVIFKKDGKILEYKK